MKKNSLRTFKNRARKQILQIYHSHFSIKHDSRNIFVHFPNNILLVRVSNGSVTRWIPTIANWSVPKSRYDLPKTIDTLAPIRKLLVDPLSVKTA